MDTNPPVYQPETPEGEEPAGRGLAIASIVLGLLGPLAVFGLGFGIAALVQGSRAGRGGARGMAITGTVISAVMMIGCCSGGVLLPALGRARNEARRLLSAQQLTNIGRGLTAYAVANKEWLPPQGADWKGLLVSSGVKPGEFVPPAASLGAPFWYVPPGVPLSRVSSPAEKVVVFEDPANYRDRGTNALFLDGHVAFLTGKEMDALANLKRSDGTVYQVPRHR